MLIHFPAELSHCNSLFRNDNYYVDLFTGEYCVQRHIFHEIKNIR